MRVHRSQAVTIAAAIEESSDGSSLNRKEGDHEQDDQTHIAGGDRHGGFVRRDGFRATTARERETDRHLQWALQRHPAMQGCVLLRLYQWSNPRILRFRSAVKGAESQTTKPMPQEA